MESKLQIGIVGLIHDHVWDILSQFNQVKNAIVTCAADLNVSLLEKVKNFGIKNTYKFYHEMLQNEKLDAVIVYNENSHHVDVVEMAANLGIHAMVEKPMAANLDQAKEMYRCAEKSGIKLMINYPTAWWSTIIHGYKMAKDGCIGKLYQVRYRAAHQGPKEMGCSKYFYEWLYDKELNGGGALIDYCCYGASMSRWTFGIPTKVIALGGKYVREYLTVEDNSILLMDYKKAMGIAEASWSQIGEGIPPRYTLIFNGSEGVIAAGEELKICTSEEGDFQKILPPQLDKGSRNGPEHFITCIHEDKPFKDLVSPLNNLDTQLILEAGLISMKEDRAVYLKELI
jgi:predicted dehydrogenase